MKKIVVIYKSKYGTTKQYAAWLAKELEADLLERDAVKPEQIADYDIVVYGGGLYAGGIAGIDLVTQSPPRHLVVFTVGLADPANTDYAEILNKNFSPELLAATKIFHLRGGIDYKKLGIVHKGMMAMMKNMVSKKPPEQLTDEDRHLLETYGKQVDFVDPAAIKPIVEYIRSL